jgi:hypothetical protein
MTREQVKSQLQEILGGFLSARGRDPDIVINGVPPKNDPDQLSLATDLKLTTSPDYGTIAKQISETFSISFPWDDVRDSGTFGDLINAVFRAITASVRAAGGSN